MLEDIGFLRADDLSTGCGPHVWGPGFSAHTAMATGQTGT